MGKASSFVMVHALFPLGIVGVGSMPDAGAPVPRAEAPTQDFTGSWQTTFFEADGPPTLGLATFGADGTLVTAEHPVVTPPMATGVVYTSSGHGVWAATGAGAARLTFVGLGSTGEGALFAVVTAHATITLGADGQTFSGDVVWSIADRAGNLLATYPGMYEGARILAEAPGMFPPAARRRAR